MEGCGRKVGDYDCCTIIQADSRVALKGIPDGYVHLVLTDPPYGVGLEYDGYQDNPENLREIVDTIIPEIFRISPLTMLTPGIKNICLYPQPDWIMCWYMSNGEFRGPWGFNCWQPILCYGGDPMLANGLGSRPDVIAMPGPQSMKSIHPCPKPHKLWRALLCRAFPTLTSNSIRRVVDPFSGSGATARCCKMMGLHFLCFEQSSKYVTESIQLLDYMPEPLFDDGL